MDTATTTCADGLRCPSGKMCVDGIGAPDRCELANLVTACEGKSDAEACLHSSGTLALCQGGVCTPVACGNGYVETVDTAGEACDDGNTQDNDGCSSDCQRQCGDRIVQKEQGEICDGTPPPGKHCVDEGFDMGTLGCADSCAAVSTDACLSFGWQPVAVTAAEQQSWHFLRTWVVSPTQVFAVGVESNVLQDPASHLCSTCGRIFSYDGNTWTVALEGVPTLLGLWGSGADDIFAAGILGNIWHFDGSEWSQMQVEEEYHLGAVWGRGPQDVFAAGMRWQRGMELTDTAFAVLHYDGNPEGRWTPMDVSQAPPVPEAKLFGIWGSSPDEVLTVGQGGTILRYDGNEAGTWVPVSPELEAAPIDELLVDIWSPGDGSAIVVGKNGTILRYDGGIGSPDAPDARWSVMATPTRANLLGVWGDGHGQVFAVGVNGTLLHHDAHAGGGWTTVESGTTYHLAHIHGSSVGNILAVGQNGTVLRSGGTDWSAMSLLGYQHNVNGIWGSAPGCIYAVTSGGEIWHYDGNPAARWVLMGSGSGELLRNVHGLGCGDEVYAVGMNGAILRYVNDAWTAMASATTRNVNGVWVGARDAVFAVGQDGIILRYDGNPEGRWAPMDAQVGGELWAVWGTAADDVFAVGRDGTILHHGAEGRWTAMDSGTDLHLYDVWGSASHDVFAVGEAGVIVHYDGEQWQRMDSEYFAYLESVWGSGPDDVFAAGQAGVLLHYDGTRWSPVRSPADIKLLSVWTPPQGKQVLIADEDGRIHRLARYRN